MPRVKRSVHARKKRRKVLEQAKGYWGLKNSNYTYAKEQVERSLAYAYRDRKVRKREFRKLWIMRINAGARANGLSYNQFIAGLKAAEHRARPEGARGSRGHRSGEVRRDRRAGQGRARQREISRQAEIFSRQAAYCDGRSPLYAAALPPARGRSAGRRRRARPRLGLSAAAARRPALPRARAARRRGTTSTPRSTSTRAFLARWCRGAGGADERGAALVGAPARRSSRSPTGGRSTCSSSARPRARTCSGTATATATRRATWGTGALELTRRRPRPAAGRAARTRRRGRRGAAAST